MEKLIESSVRKINSFNQKFERYLFSKINWDNRLISIKGARGSGKTTLLLQYAKLLQKKQHSVLYIAMDDLFFLKNNLLELAEKFEQLGGSYLLIDEVHKYPNWSREIKLIYDDFPNLKTVFTSSSILEIFKSESDLSRRVVNYDLKELSFREFLELNGTQKVSSFSLEEILLNHTEIASDLLNSFKPIFSFNHYIKNGVYPYFLEDLESYHQKIINTINLIIDVDIHAVENIDYQILIKLKKLLFMISVNVPFTINISKMSEIIGVSRPTLLHALSLLERARLIVQMNKSNKGIGILTKPEKIYLNNTNLAYALGDEQVNVGTNRETFFVNQLSGIHQVELSDKADFIVDNKYTFEVGGKNKKQLQIKGIPDSFIVKDTIEIGVGNIVPLYLFGLLY
jgi:predicted AAA+ superfamily ATPase